MRLEIAAERPGPGAWLPASALVDGGSGLWAALTLDETVEPPVARRALVQVEATDGARVYVRGDFGGATRVIAEGGHRVAPGQPVRIDTGA